MPYLAKLTVLLLLSAPLLADSYRNEFIREQLESDADTRMERIGQTLSGPCVCANGEPLKGTQGLVFNCTCGSMQCVVAGSKSGASAQAGGFNLFCR